jgi:peptide/nickel transport system substrate-binding protein
MRGCGRPSCLRKPGFSRSAHADNLTPLSVLAAAWRTAVRRKPCFPLNQLRTVRGDVSGAVTLDRSMEFPETARMPLQKKLAHVFVLWVFAISACIALAPAQQKETPEFLRRANLSGTRGGNLTASLTADPSTFNRIFARSVANSIVTEALSADLVHINRRTYALEPALASRWEVAKDNRTYTIHLRRGLRFSDGSPFTAEDVVYTLNALQDPKNASGMADQLQIDDKFPAITQIDSYTVRFAWPRPVGTGLRALDAIPMLPKARLAKMYPDGVLASSWGPSTPPQDVVGMGPFRLKEYQRGTRIVLERNPYYWKIDKNGQALPYLDSLTFLIIPDRNAEALRFQAGDIDLLGTMNPENYAALRRAERAAQYTLQDIGPGLGMDFLWFNLNPGKSAAGTPFVDPEKLALFQQAAFRQAVSFSLDRKAMAQAVWGGLATPQVGPISSGNVVWFNSSLPSPVFDPRRAQNLLASLKLKDSNADGLLEYGTRPRPLEITLLSARGNPAREKTAEIIKQYLGQVGIRVSVQLLLPNELALRFMNTFEYEAVLFGNTPTDVVPDLQSTIWYSGGANHFWYPSQSKPATGWEQQVDSLTTEFIQSLDDPTRKRAFRQVQDIWIREMPAIATLAPDILSGWSNSVGNVQPSILLPYLLWNVEELTKRMR